MLKRILLPVDGSEHSYEALSFIASRSAWLEAEKPVVTLLNVEPPIPAHLAAAFSIFDRDAYAADQANKVFKKLEPVAAEMPAAPERQREEVEAADCEQVCAQRQQPVEKPVQQPIHTAPRCLAPRR